MQVPKIKSKYLLLNEIKKIMKKKSEKSNR